MLRHVDLNHDATYENELLNEKLMYLETSKTEKVRAFILKYLEVFASSFENVRPSAVSVRKGLELTSNKLINQNARRMSLMHKEPKKGSHIGLIGL